jgi:hypothetical protein
VEIQVEVDESGQDYNFGERGLLPQFVSVRLFLGSASVDSDTLRLLEASGWEHAGHRDHASAIRGRTTASIVRLPDRLTNASAESPAVVESSAPPAPLAESIQPADGSDPSLTAEAEASPFVGPLPDAAAKEAAFSPPAAARAPQPSGLKCEFAGYPSGLEAHGELGTTDQVLDLRRTAAARDLRALGIDAALPTLVPWVPELLAEPPVHPPAESYAEAAKIVFAEAELPFGPLADF